MRPVIFRLLALGPLSLAVTLLPAQTWVLDPAVAPVIEQEHRAVSAFAPLPDGGVIVYGGFSHINRIAVPGNLAKLMADGRLDPAFAGEYVAPAFPAIVAPLSDGRLIANVLESPRAHEPPGALGMVNSYPPEPEARTVAPPEAVRTIAPSGPRGRLERLQSDGRRDGSFTALSCDGYPRLWPLADGRVLVWGTFSRLGGAVRNSLARLNADGTLDATFAPVLAPTQIAVTAVAPAPEGAIFVSAWTYERNTPVYLFLRLDGTGAVDRRFAPAVPDASFTLLAAQTDGGVLAGVNTLFRYTPTGALDFSYAVQIPAMRALSRVAPLAEGRVIVEALVQASGSGNAQPAIFTLSRHGRVERDFRTFPGGQATQRLLAVFSDETVLAEFGEPELWRTSPSGDFTKLAATATRRTEPRIQVLDTDDRGRAYVSGQFSLVDEQPRPGIARFLASGRLDHTFQPPAGGMVFLLADGRAIVRTPGRTVRLRDDGSIDPGFNVPAELENGEVKYLTAAPDGRLLVAAFEPDNRREQNLKLFWLGTDGRPGPALPARFSSFTLFRVTLDGSTIPQFPNVITSARLLADGQLLVAGYFLQVDGASRPGIARLRADGSLDPTYAPVLPQSNFRPGWPLPDGSAFTSALTFFSGANNIVFRIGTDGTVAPVLDLPRPSFGFFGRLLRDGSTFAGRRYAADGWPDLNFEPDLGSGPDAGRISLGTMAPDSSLWIAGSFARVNGQPRTGLARFLPVERAGFTVHPKGDSVMTAETVSFQGALGTSGPASYQWTLDDVPIPGATAAHFYLPAARLQDAGSYRLVAATAGQTFVSEPAKLQVMASTARIHNFSARTRVDLGSPQVVGLVCADVPARQLLLRAIGRGLRSAPLLPTLRIPVLTLGNSAGTLAEGRNNLSAPAIADLAARVGAPPPFFSPAFYDSGGSTGAAIAPLLGGGSYRAQIDAGDANGGIALFEFYDTGSVGAAPLVRNFSVRGRTEPGDGALIAGLVVTGNGPLRLLIRGLGPALTGLGIAGAIADPQVAVFEQSWRGPGATAGSAAAVPIIEAARMAGAFALPPNSRDAALLVSLEPGAYTVQLTSASGASGLAMLEVYAGEN